MKKKKMEQGEQPVQEVQNRADEQSGYTGYAPQSSLIEKNGQKEQFRCSSHTGHTGKGAAQEED